MSQVLFGRLRGGSHKQARRRAQAVRLPRHGSRAAAFQRRGGAAPDGDTASSPRPSQSFSRLRSEQVTSTFFLRAQEIECAYFTLICCDLLADASPESKARGAPPASALRRAHSCGGAFAARLARPPSDSGTPLPPRVQAKLAALEELTTSGPELRLRDAFLPELKQLLDAAFSGSAAVAAVTPDQLYGLLKREASGRAPRAPSGASVSRERRARLTAAPPSLVSAADQLVWGDGAAAGGRRAEPRDAGHGGLPALLAHEPLCARDTPRLLGRLCASAAPPIRAQRRRCPAMRAFPRRPRSVLPERGPLRRLRRPCGGGRGRPLHRHHAQGAAPPPPPTLSPTRRIHLPPRARSSCGEPRPPPPADAAATPPSTAPPRQAMDGIKAGAEALTAYFPVSWGLEDRQEHLEEEYGFACRRAGQRGTGGEGNRFAGP